MRSMQIWLRLCALYNLAGGAALVAPGVLDLFGVALPGSPFWLWLPALLGSFGAIALSIASTDLNIYAPLAYWNAVIRLVYASATFALGFADTMGPFAAYLGAGDAVLGLVVLLGLPLVTGRSPASFLMNGMARA